MKVTGPGQIKTSNVKQKDKKKASDGEAFRSNLKTGSTETTPVSVLSGTAPLTAVDALLALQEVPSSDQGRSKGLQRGNEMLDRMEDIRQGLLLGMIPKSKLYALAKAVREQRQQMTDPRLMALLDEIELRAKVELAKLGLI